MRLTYAGLFTVLLFGCAAGAPQPGIDDSDLVVLHHNVRPQARPEMRVGHTAPGTPMERMILALKPDADRQAQLDGLLARLQDPASPDFHRWLTPQEFGERFGRTPEEIAKVTGWLSAHGFAVEEIGAGRTYQLFRHGVRRRGGVPHYDRRLSHRREGQARNSVDPSIPRALSGMVAGIVSLHNIPRRAMNTGFRRFDGNQPALDYTGSTGTHALSPGDFGIIYNVKAVYTAGFDGTGRTVAVVARTHPAASNWATFRTNMKLPANAPVVVVNGTDPGDKGADEDGEADLDIEWSGGIAKGATAKFVVSCGSNDTNNKWSQRHQRRRRPLGAVHRRQQSRGRDDHELRQLRVGHGLV